MCVRSGVALTCQLRTSFRVDAVSGVRAPGAVAGSETMPRSSLTGRDDRERRPPRGRAASQH